MAGEGATVRLANNRLGGEGFGAIIRQTSGKVEIHRDDVRVVGRRWQRIIQQQKVRPYWLSRSIQLADWMMP
jgi:hypothetical protein